MSAYAVTVWEKLAVFTERIKETSCMLKNYFGIPACHFQFDLQDTKYGYDAANLTHISYNFT